MRRTTLLTVGVALLLTAALESAPRAESPTHELAKKHYATGKSYYEIANYKEALDEFEKAYKLQPLPALLYNIGRCHESLGNLKAAVASYRDYLAREKEISDRATIEARIANLEKRIKPAEPAPPTEAQPVAPPAEASPVPDATDRPRWRRPTGWALVGVGGAALVVGIVGGVMVKQKNNEFTQGAGNKTYTELQQIADLGKRWQSVEIASLVVGGVLAAAGGGLLIWDAMGKSKRRTSALRLTPFVSAAGFGLAGAARF
jgi:tetratricopeptide (TPR) repeat protein